MAQIVYRNRHGVQVAVRNPTPADMDALWDDWKAQHGARLNRVFITELRRSGSIFADPEIYPKHADILNPEAS